MINYDPKMAELRRKWQSEDPAGKDTLHTLEQGIVEVENWARARGIIPNSTGTAQLLKAVSEMGELADDHNKGNAHGKVDGVGDVLVCLINYCALEDLSMRECLDRAWKSIRGRKGTMNANGVFIKEAESPEEIARRAKTAFAKACRDVGLDPDELVMLHDAKRQQRGHNDVNPLAPIGSPVHPATAVAVGAPLQRPGQVAEPFAPASGRWNGPVTREGRPAPIGEMNMQTADITSGAAVMIGESAVRPSPDLSGMVRQGSSLKPAEQLDDGYSKP